MHARGDHSATPAGGAINATRGSVWGPRATRRREQQHGYTLVELLVVIAVLASLALIVVPNLTAVAGHTSSVRCATDLESMQSASSAYKNDHGAYATSDGGPGVLTPSLITPYYLHTWPGEKVWSIDANGTVLQTCP